MSVGRILPSVLMIGAGYSVVKSCEIRSLTATGGDSPCNPECLIAVAVDDNAACSGRDAGLSSVPGLYWYATAVLPVLTDTNFVFELTETGVIYVLAGCFARGTDTASRHGRVTGAGILLGTPCWLY